MSAPSASTPLRNSESKLFNACLDYCVEGLENFSISKPRVSRGLVEEPSASRELTAFVPALANTLSTSNDVNTTPAASTTLPSPPSTPHRPKPSRALASSSAADMDRNPLHGAPQRGGPISYSSQDARGNLAVQPVAAPAKINLKKATVKIRTEGAPPSAVGVAPAVSKPTPIEVPDTNVSVASHKDLIDGLKAMALSKSPLPTPTPKATPQLSAMVNNVEAGLDAMFARLTSPETLTVSSPKPTVFTTTKPVSKGELASSPENAKPLNLDVNNAQKKKAEPKELQSDKPAASDIFPGDDWQREYFGKALHYLMSLPTKEDTPVRHIQTVAQKLPSFNDAPDDVRAKYVGEIVTYLSGLSRNSGKHVEADSVEEDLQDHGNFLVLREKLVRKGYLTVDSLDEVTGLCKAFLSVLPSTPAPQEAVSNDPMDKMGAWPSQEKRENIPGCRTITLKGVGHLKSINQLQALVWGGKLESIHLPEPGKEFAMIKFLTPEACQKYFDATENGIEVPGDKTGSVIFVERQPGPNSVSDVLRNCADGDASRCVQALDADEDWDDAVLLNLARGNSKVKREVDRIKRGKSARGRYFIEFRFASIYHALNFKRELTAEEDWEHCRIVYAPDPCETARGVHLKDDDED